MNPITETETHFLDPEGDLVSIFEEQVRVGRAEDCASTTSYTTEQTSSTSSSSSSRYSDLGCKSQSSTNVLHSPTPSTTHTTSLTSSPTPMPTPSQPPDHIQTLALALAVSVLVPILAFSTIPGLLGRITAASLVVGGVLAVLIQGGVVGREILMRSEGLVCTGVYAGVMVVVAGLF